MNNLTNKWLPLVALGLILFSGFAMAGTPIETTVARLVDGVQKLGNTVDGLLLDVDSLNNHVASIDSNISIVYASISSNANKILTLQVAKNQLEADLNTTMLDLTSTQAGLSDLEVVVDGLGVQQGLFSQDLNQTQESLSVVTGDVFALGGELSAFKDKFVIKQVFDDNSTGWNPGAGVDAFVIAEPAITAQSVVMTTATGVGNGVQNCYVRTLVPSTSFTVKCDAVPNNGAVLNYVVMNP